MYMVMHQTLRNYKLFVIFFFFPNLLLSESFNLTEVADGIFVHYGVHEDSNPSNDGDISNLGFIIGKKSVLVIDAGGTEQIAEKLILKIKEKTKLPISHLVITHGHPDHFIGSSAFTKFNPIVVGHENLERSLSMNFNFYRLLQATDIEQKIVLDTKPVLPNLKIKKNESIEIDLGERKLTIKAWPSAHTDNDLSIFDLKTNIIWSELFFEKRIPSIGASILGWKKNLEAIKKDSVKMIIPGHGTFGEKNKIIDPMLNYFNRIIDHVRNAHKTGKTIEETTQNKKANNIENWLLFNEYHIRNVTKAYSELEWE